MKANQVTLILTYSDVERILRRMTAEGTAAIVLRGKPKVSGDGESIAMKNVYFLNHDCTAEISLT